VTPEQFGAKGDGVTDDSAALQNAINSLVPGNTLLLSGTYAHNKVITVAVAGVTISGTGTLLATNEQYSAVFINADNVTVTGINLKMQSTTKRWVAYEQMKLRLGSKTGIKVSNITIDGSAAAGLYVGGSSNFTISDVVISNTRADALHMTEGANFGTVSRVTANNPGDDGVAVVSYNGSGLCHDITIDSPRQVGQLWGRGFSVVGGDRITYRNIYSDHSNAAAVYIAAEPSYNTYASSNVLVDGGTIQYANQSATVVHGAVLVYSGQTTLQHDITIQNLTISNTKQLADIRIVSDNTSTNVQSNIRYQNITITGGPSSAYQGNALSSWYNTVSIIKNGVTLPDHIGL
jgi:hypothetical protein